LALLGLVQSIYSGVMIPETLAPAQRKAFDLKSAANPFGFMNVFTKGSAGLRKMVATTTLQMSLEGKNISDLVVGVWEREHLGWGTQMVVAFTSTYGVLCTLSGWYITPYVLRNFGTRAFTSTCNWLNAIGFVLRSHPQPWAFFTAVIPMLPGVNGASATALKQVSTDVASGEGFGKGEFQAWANNLRAIQGALIPLVVGYTYTLSKAKGLHPGTFYWVISVLGALLPELILKFITDAEMSPKANRQ